MLLALQLTIHYQSELGLLIKITIAVTSITLYSHLTRYFTEGLQEVLKVTANQNKTILVRYGIVLQLAISKKWEVLISIKH